MKEQKIRDHYTYYFTDGTKSVVTAKELGQEWINVLTDMGEDDRKARYNYGRHNVPLSAFTYDGEKFADSNGDLFIKLMQQIESEKFDNVLDMLTDSQRELFEAIYYKERKIIDIAAEQGVCQPAISNRLDRIRKKF